MLSILFASLLTGYNLDGVFSSPMKVGGWGVQLVLALVSLCEFFYLFCPDFFIHTPN